MQRRVLHGMDSREPFIAMGIDEHAHFCPVHGGRYPCKDPQFPDGDSDCRWYDVVVCPACLRAREQLAAG